MDDRHTFGPLDPADLARLTVDAVAPHGFDARLLAALVQIESGGNPSAWNPEPRYRYLWDVRHHRPFRGLTGVESASEVPPLDFPTIAGDRDQEWWGQQASWGLCQLMGAVARELGCRAPFLPTLVFDPRLNLELAAQHLAALLRWAGGDPAQALAAYNAGKGGYASSAGTSYARLVLLTHAALPPLRDSGVQRGEI